MQGLVLSICRRPATWADFMQIGLDLGASILTEIKQCRLTEGIVFDVVRSLKIPSTLHSPHLIWHMPAPAAVQQWCLALCHTHVNAAGWCAILWGAVA